MITANYRSVDEAKNFLLHSYEYSPLQEKRKHALQLKAFEYIEEYTGKSIYDVIDDFIERLTPPDDQIYNFAIVTVSPWDIWETKAQILINDFKYLLANYKEVRKTNEYKFDELYVVKDWLVNIAPKGDVWLGGKPFEYTFEIETDRNFDSKILHVYHNCEEVGTIEAGSTSYSYGSDKLTAYGFGLVPDSINDYVLAVEAVRSLTGIEAVHILKGFAFNGYKAPKNDPEEFKPW